ncbi:MAG: winged helix-turn-helix domain-containing protein, partial [Proteobacteria bacterium]|nr:winged helix-turn-helix domain-containing protein [Pseudomonadota bacterium]
NIQKLSKQEVRKLVVLSNNFHHNGKLKSAEGTLRSIRELGYVQLDTISVVNRAHLHVLWSRNHNFQQSHLDLLLKQKRIFEYWSHAAAILPIESYPYSLVKKKQLSKGDKHWFERDLEMMDQVIKVISSEGPKKSSDFKHDREDNGGWWEWKPAKQALERLFMEGSLMVAERRGFQKVYDLTANVIPTDVDNSLPSSQAFYDHLIRNYLNTQGLGKAKQIAYLRKGLRLPIEERLEQMFVKGELEKVRFKEEEYYTLPGRLSVLNKRQKRIVHILSPFDNMVIQREPLNQLFDFDYQIECYVPAAKR